MKVVFMGRKTYAAELLEWTVNNGIEVVSVVTDSYCINSPTAKKSRELEIPIQTLEEVEESFNSKNDYADLVVSYLFWRKIREPLISTPQLGCINFHPAILPFWRGTAGYNIAILYKMEEWGATAHYVDSSIDTGSIIKTYKFNFDYRKETAYTLEEKTQKIQQDLYKSVILDVADKGRLNSTTQPVNQGIYISRQQMEDMKHIDVENDDIDLKIKAFWFPPYTGAFVEIKGKKYTLVNDEILKSITK